MHLFFVWLLSKYLENFEFELSIDLLIHIPFQRFPNSTSFIMSFTFLFNFKFKGTRTWEYLKVSRYSKMTPRNQFQ